MSNKVLAGRYELVEKIGDGGMAVVYKAMDKLLNRYVAVKILKPQFTEDEKFIESFRKESHAAASLSHGNIVGVYDVGREGNINYIVMELVKGLPLSDIIKQEGPLDYNTVIDITRQIASGLSAAHKHGIIHRDIKPHNILINEDGVAKIADFGIAKAVSVATIVENTNNSIIGSVHYFSPEQARGGAVDERSDIYSLGIVMYEMLTGEVPFDGDNPVTIALMHVNDAVTPPSKLVSNIPPALEKVVMKATDKYQLNRFQSADDLIEALDEIELIGRVVGNHGITQSGARPGADAAAAAMAAQEAAQQSTQKKEEKGKKNKKRLIIILAVLGVLLVGAATAFFMGAFGKGEVAVPDIKGMTYEQAEERLQKDGLVIKKGDEVYSDTYNEGEIVSQDPTADTMVKKGTKVTVDISKGLKSGIVPNVVGKTQEEAEKAITDKDFVVGTVKEETSTKAKGTVIAQDPEGGMEADAGTVINLTISDGKGKEQVSVPDVRGLTEDEAKASLEGSGLNLGNVSEEASTKFSKGIVMSQQYEVGTKVDEGSSVDIVISTGATSTIKYYIDFDAAKQEVFYMTVTVTDDNGTRNVVTKKQCAKADGGEEISIKGTGKGRIVVTFDDQTVFTQEVDFASGTEI